MQEMKIRTFPRSLPRALESVARLVPGYRGYASKGERREEDKRLRAQIVRTLRESSQDLHRALRAMRFDGVPPGLNRLGQVTRRIDRVVDDVIRGAYAYPGFFDPVRVDERRLELLYRADMAVAEAVQGVTAEVQAWTIAPDLERDGGASLASVEIALDLVEHSWRTRREMLAEE
jgi:hypothetical protein